MAETQLTRKLIEKWFLRMIGGGEYSRAYSCQCAQAYIL